MSATTQVTTFSDLYTDLQNRVLIDTGVTATENEAKRYINIALQDMHLGFDYRFPWAERDAVLRLRPRYNTGTVSINKGSSTLTGSGTAWATADDFGDNNARPIGKIVIGSNVYGITTVGSDTSITLTQPYIGENLSAGGYVYFEDEYDLDADFLRPLDLQIFSAAANITLIGRTEFRRRYPRNSTPGKPIAATILDQHFESSTAPVRRVRFHPPPSTLQLVPYSFITDKLAVQSNGTAAVNLSSDTDEPIVPLRYRHALIFHALYHWYRDKKNDDRSVEAKGEYTDIMLRVAGDDEAGSKKPRLTPAVSAYRRAAERPWSGASSRYTLGSRFDEIR